MVQAELPIVGIVDDDYAVRDSLRFLLEVAGHSVRTFESATDFVGSDTRNLKCLVLDYHMAGMDGLELTERLRARGCDIPILLITGLPSPAIVRRAAQLGIDRVLPKPFAEEDLLNFVNANALAH